MTETTKTALAAYVDEYLASGLTLTKALRKAKVEIVEEAKEKWGPGKAARVLGVSRRTVQRIANTGRNA